MTHRIFKLDLSQVLSFATFASTSVELTSDSSECNILKYRFKTSLGTAIKGEILSSKMKTPLPQYIDFAFDEHRILEAASDHSSNNSSAQRDDVVQVSQAQALGLSGQ